MNGCGAWVHTPCIPGTWFPANPMGYFTVGVAFVFGAFVLLGLALAIDEAVHRLAKGRGRRT